jgi:hypothetical protein
MYISPRELTPAQRNANQFGNRSLIQTRFAVMTDKLPTGDGETAVDNMNLILN